MAFHGTPLIVRALLSGLATAAIPLALLLIFVARGETANPMIGHFLTVLTIASGVSVALLQLSKQHESAQALQSEQHQTALKLQVYERLAPLLRAAQATNSRRRGYVEWARLNIASYSRSRASGSNHAAPPPQRAQELMRIESEAGDAALALLVEVEAWKVALDGGELYQRALSCALYDLQYSYHRMFPLIVPLLPMELPDRVTAPEATEAQIAHLFSAASAFIDDMDSLSGYIDDILVEAQMELLGGLFHRQIRRRNPIDPKVVVLDLRKKDELLHYFENLTPQASAYAAAAADVRAALVDDRPVVGG